MRLSANTNSEHYWALHTGGKTPFVFCDGEEVKYAVEVDTEAGWVEYYPTDANDKFMLDDDNPENIRVARRTGVVTVELRNPT